MNSFFLTKEYIFTDYKRWKFKNFLGNIFVINELKKTGVLCSRSKIKQRIISYYVQILFNIEQYFCFIVYWFIYLAFFH